MPIDLFAEESTPAKPLDLFKEEAVPVDNSSGNPLDLFKDNKTPPKDKPEYKQTFAGKHPTLYGVGRGAVGQSILEAVPYAKFFVEDERDKFMKLDKQHQVRSLLMEDLLLVLYGFGKPITEAAKAAAAGLGKVFPKTADKLVKMANTRIGGAGGKKGLKVTEKIAEYEAKNGGESPPIGLLTKWWDDAGYLVGEKDKTAKKVVNMYQAAEAESKRIKRPTIDKLVKSLRHKFIDVSGNAKATILKEGGEAGKKAVMRHDLIAGAGHKALKEVDEASKIIYKGLNRSEVKDLNRVIQSRRTIAIEKYKNIKHPGKLGRAEHEEYLKSLPEDYAKTLNQRADSYFGAMRGQLKQMLDEGIISNESYEAMIKAGDYSPRKVLKYVDPENAHTFDGQRISVASSGLKSLDTGTTSLLENNSEQLLTEVVARTQNRIFRNRANKALYQMAEANPDNGLVKIATPHQKVPAGFERLSVMKEGRAKHVIMPSNIAKEWVLRDPQINAQLANVVGWVSGSKILKPMATGYNPEFAVTNLPRDIAHVFLTTTEYSPTLPKAAFQMGKDVLAVLPDAVVRKGSYFDYINQGGGMEFLTNQGQTTMLKGAFKGLRDFFGYVGETSEILTRLALRRRALMNGATGEEATWTARNYLDFSQGGSWAKAADTGVPYLNAGVQGTRGIARAAIKDPAVFAYKTAQIGTLASGLYLANRFKNPENYAQIAERDKINNWIITTPWSYTDDKGTNRHVYFKIAKDQGQRVMSTIFENLMAKSMGEDIDVDQITQSLQDAIPYMPTQSLPPTVKALLGYSANKDFWRNEDIWKGGEVSPEEEYTRYTPESFVKIGQATGTSPERNRYALQQVFTQGNVYTALVGHGWDALTKDLPEAEKSKLTADTILSQPFIRRVAKATDPYNQYGKLMKEAEMAASTERLIRGREFDTLSQEYYDGEASMEDIKTFIRGAPDYDKKRLLRRHRNRSKLQNLPDMRWWLELSDMTSPEAKAYVYWTRLNNSTEEQKKELKEQLTSAPGVASKKFYRALKKLDK